MAFSEMTDDLDIIAKYPDEPYEEEGFTSTAFKASFDKGAKLCKEALNKLVKELGRPTAAANVGFRKTSGIPVAEENVQRAIEYVHSNLMQNMQQMSQGSVSDGSITTEKLDDGSVTSSKLAPDSVWSQNIGIGAVESGNIEDGAVTAVKLDDGAVTSDKLGSKAVTEEKLGNGAVTTDKLATDSVTGDKLAEGAVGSAALATGAVLKEHLAPSLMAIDVSSAVPVAGAPCTAVTASAATNVRGRFLYFPLFGVVLFLISFDGNSGTNRIKFTGNRYIPGSNGISAVAVGADGTNYSVSYTAKAEKQAWDNDGIFVARGGAGAALVLGWYFTEG